MKTPSRQSAVPLGGLAILTAVVTMLVAPSARAGDRTSIASGNWFDGSIWIPVGSPLPGDSATVAAGHSVTAASAIAVDQLTIDGSLTASAGLTLLAGAMLVNPGGSFTASGTVEIPQSFDVYGTLDVSGATMSFVGSTPGFTVGGGTTFGAVNVAPNTYVSGFAGGSLTVSGPVDIGDAGIFDVFTNSGQLNLGGNITMGDDAQISDLNPIELNGSSRNISCTGNGRVSIIGYGGLSFVGATNFSSGGGLCSVFLQGYSITAATPVTFNSYDGTLDLEVGGGLLDLPQDCFPSPCPCPSVLAQDGTQIREPECFTEVIAVGDVSLDSAGASAWYISRVLLGDLSTPGTLSAPSAPRSIVVEYMGPFIDNFSCLEGPGGSFSPGQSTVEFRTPYPGCLGPAPAIKDLTFYNVEVYPAQAVEFDGTVNVQNDFTVNSGSTLTSAGTLTIAGTLTNGGTITGSLTAQSFVQQAGGTFAPVVRAAADNDKLTVIASASLAGALIPTGASGFSASAGQSYTFLQAGSLSGTMTVQQTQFFPKGLGFTPNYSASAMSLDFFALQHDLSVTGNQLVGAVGSSVVLTLSPLNAGPDSAPEVLVSANIPNTFGIDSVAAPEFNCSTSSGGTVTCRTVSFGASQQGSIAITLVPRTAANGTFAVSIESQSLAVDIAPQNNNHSISYEVSAAPEPARVVVESMPAAMLQEAGGSGATTTLVLTNAGGTQTAIQLSQQGSFFTAAPSSFSLGAGASQQVVISATPQPVGSYSGSVTPRGAGVPGSLLLPIQLVSYGPPGATVPDVIPVRLRVDVVGQGDVVSGQVEFRNVGAGPATGVVVSDDPWLIPASGATTIAPAQTASVAFTIDRRLRFDPTGTGSVFTTIRFVYPVPALAGGRLEPFASGALAFGTGATVSDTNLAAPVTAGLPAIPAGQRGLTLPGVVNGTRAIGRVVTDVTIGASREIKDLAMYLVELALTSGTATRTSGTVNSNSPLKLADSLGKSFGQREVQGSLHLRSANVQDLSVSAFVQLIADAQQAVYVRDQPSGRSDRGANGGESVWLTGLGLLRAAPGPVLIQELTGAATSAEIEIFDEAGQSLSKTSAIAVAAFQLVSHPTTLPAGAATLVVRNIGAEGRLIATMGENDATRLDGRDVLDWSYDEAGGGRGDERIIPLVATSGGTGATPPRRRPVRRVSGSDLRSPSGSDEAAPAALESTSVALFAAGPAKMELTYFEGGAQTVRTVDLAARATKQFEDVLAELFDRSSAGKGYLRLRALSGEFGVTAWRTERDAQGELSVTTLPIIAASAGLQIEGMREITGVPDASDESARGRVPSMYRSSLALVEASGSDAQVEVSVSYPDGRNLFQGTNGKKTFAVGANRQLIIDDLVRTVAGSSRDSLNKDLYDVRVRVRVVSGSGRIIPLVVSQNLGSGDFYLRSK